MAGTPKPKMICPFCDDERAFAKNGMTTHVRAKHPEQLKNFQENIEKFFEKYRCDEFGNPITPVDRKEPEPPAEEVESPEPAKDDGFLEEPEPEVPEEPEPEPEPPKEPEKPEPKPKPEPEPEQPGFFRKLALDIGFTDD